MRTAQSRCTIRSRRRLRSLIISGAITEGTLLPSIREFAGDLKCSVITVRRVYQDLENEGLLRTRQGTGTFVSHIGTGAMEDYKQETVRKALESAVEAGLSVHCSEEELTRLFTEIVKNKYGKQAERGEADGTASHRTAGCMEEAAQQDHRADESPAAARIYYSAGGPERRGQKHAAEYAPAADFAG